MATEGATDDENGPAPGPPAGDLSPEGRARDRRLQVPVPLLRQVAEQLAGVADPVREAGAVPALVHSAGPASAVVAGLLRDVDGAMAGLAHRLTAASTAMRETADDLDGTDAEAAQRFLGAQAGDLFVSPGE